jgi:hypothetical protein
MDADVLGGLANMHGAALYWLPQFGNMESSGSELVKRTMGEISR